MIGDQMKNRNWVCVLVVSLFAFVRPATAQEIVHALTGTVSTIDPSNKTITVFQDSGSASTFKVMTSAKTRISFDEEVSKASTPAKEFEKQGSYAILFYYGMDQNRTAVAVKGLGEGPFSSTKGQVTDWDGHSHTLVVTSQDGAKHTFKVGEETVAETYSGAVDGSDFRVEKGDRVRVVSSGKGGNRTALFVRLM